MKRITTYLFLLIGITIGNHSIAQRTCGTEAYYQKSIIEDPSIIQSTLEAKLLYQQWLKTHPDGGAKKSGTILKIPVVVHVIYENPTENISEAQVISQIEVLNDDYRKLNADTGNVPTWFKPIAADTEIEFVLAVRDPNGNTTNGITRTSTTVTNFSSANPKSTSAGGKDGWPPKEYLNFWVCDLGNGLLGYAIPPSSNPGSNDGVVCGYKYVGKAPDNPFGGAFNKGRTATHEVGHWLGLDHTFLGGCSGMTASNCSSQGDGICDTPPTSNNNYGCPSDNQNTCAETPIDLNDQHMNYMDYVDDGCMNMFTDDQKARMRAIINTSRSGLLTSLGATPVSALDASIALVVPSDTTCGSDQFAPVITLTNYGSTTLATTTISYQVDTNSIDTYSWSGNLATQETEEITLPMIVTSFGSHTFQAWTSMPNGSSDEVTSNDSSSSSFTFMNGNSVNLTLDFDTFQVAHLVSWDIRDSSDVVVDANGGYAQNTTTIESICLVPGCYTFNLYNYVDNGEGAFTLVDIAGDTIISQNDIFTFNQSFCVTLPPASIQNFNTLDELIMIYPNPSSGLVRISSSLAEGVIQKIRILNTVGQQVHAFEHPKSLAGYAELDLSFLNDGVYFISILTSEGNLTKKISLIR